MQYFFWLFFVIYTFLANSIHPLYGNIIYAIGDSYKVLPDGTILELYQSSGKAMKRKNIIWNQQEKKVHIYGSRNETVAFQVIIEGQHQNIRLESSPFQGTTEIKKISLSFHLIDYVSWNGRFYPDIVIPFAALPTHSFSIPYNLGFVPIPYQRVGVVMIEIKIPSTVPSGSYTTKIHLTANDMDEEFIVQLSVWDITLPKRPSITFDINSYASPVKALIKDQRNPYHSTPKNVIQLEHHFYRTAHQHRAYLNILPTHSQRGMPFYTPALHGKGKDIRCEWSEWDKRFAPVLDGTIFENGIPPPYFYLPFNLHWPWGYSHDAGLKDQRKNWRKRRDYKENATQLLPKEYLQEWKAVAKQYVEHFAMKGWTKDTTFQVYLNHTNKENANSPWRLDEPYNRWDFQVLAYYAGLTYRTFSNKMGVKIRYRLDLGHFYCRSSGMKCNHPKNYDLSLARHGGGKELLEPVVDIWYIGASHVWGNRKQIKLLQNLDSRKEAFIYSGGQRVSDIATIHRGLLWYLYDIGISGYCAWNQGCYDAKNILKQPGFDHVWYNGKTLGYTGVLPSLRMKLWRRSSFDVEYLYLAAKKHSKKEIKSVFQRICKYKKTHPKYRNVFFPHPSTNPHNFEVARMKLAAMILGRHAGISSYFEGEFSHNLTPYGEEIKNY